MKEFDKKFLDLIKQLYTGYKTYYEILQIKRAGITDEIVKKAYKEKIKELENMCIDFPQAEIIEFKNKIRQTLDDAYTALKTENSRKHYDELLNSIKQSSEDKATKDESEEEYEL